MSTRQVDERVVEMQFDNKQFEDGVQESISTLDKLKKALRLEDAAEGFNELERAANDLDLSGAETAAKSFTDKFKGWIEEIGTGALRQLGANLTNTISQTLKSVTIDQISAGFNKYGEKTRQTATIMSATGESVETVNEQLEKLMWYTDETSYKFTDMSANIGKFTNNGVKLETAVTAMMGIGNWAGLSGASINEASRAMYNLSQAISVGSVKLMDWKSIENAGMATTEFKKQVIDTAVALGELQDAGNGVYKTFGSGKEVSVTNFNEALSEGWFTSEVLLQTLGKFGNYTEEVYKFMEEYPEKADTVSEAMAQVSSEGKELGKNAFLAAQEARTWEDAIGSVAEAVGSKLMTTFEIIFGGYEDAKVLWTSIANELWDVFAGPIEAFNDKLAPAFEKQWVNVGDKILEAGVNAEDFEQRLAAAAREAGLDVDDLVDKYGSLTNSLTSGWLSSTKLGGILDDILGSTGQTVDETAKTIMNLEDVVYDVIRGDYANNWSEANREREKLLTAAGYDAALVQDLVNRVLAGEEVNFDVVIEKQLESLGYTEDQIESIKKLRDELKDEDSDISKLLKGVSDLGDEFASVANMSGRELLFGSITNILTTIKNIVSAIGAAFRDIFPESTSRGIWEGLARIYLVTQKIHDFFGELNDDGEEAITIVDKIRSVFRGFFAVLHIGVEAVKAILGGIGKLVSFFLPSSGAVGGLLDFASGFSNIIVSFDKFLTENEVFKKAIGGTVDLIISILTPVKNTIGWIYTNVVTFLTKTINFISGCFGDLLKGTSTGMETVTKIFDKVRDVFSRFFGDWSETHTLTIEPIIEAFQWLGEKLSQIFSFISDVLTSNGSISEKLGSIFGGIGDIFGGLVGSLSKVTANISPFVSGLVGSISDGISSIGINTDSIKDKVGGFIGGIKDLFKKEKVGETITEEVTPAFEETAQVAEESVDRVEKSFGGIGGSSRGLYNSAVGPVVGMKQNIGLNMKSIEDSADGASEAVEEFGNKTEETVKAINDTAGSKAAFQPVVESFGDAMESGTEAVKSGKKSIIEVAKDIVQSVASTISNFDLFGKIKKTISAGIEKLSSSGNAVISKIGDGLKVVSGALGTVGSKIRDTVSKAPSLSKVFTVLINVFKVFIGAVAGVIAGVGMGLKLAIESLKNLGGTMGKTFKEWKSQNEGSLQPIIDMIDKAKDAIKNFFKTLGGHVDSEGEGFKEKIAKVFGVLGTIFKDILNGLIKIYNYIGPKVKAIFESIKEAISGAAKTFKKSMKDGDFESAFKGIEALLAGGAFLGIRKFFKSFKKDTRTVSQALKGTLDNLGGVFEGLTGALKGMQNELNAKALKHIGEAILLLALGIAAIALAANHGDVETAAVIIGMLTAELGGMLILFQKLGKGSSIGISKDGVNAFGDSAKSLVEFAGAILIMSVAVAMLSKMNPDQLEQGLWAMTAIMIELTGSIAVMQAGQQLTAGEKYTTKIGKTIVAMAVAMMAMIKVVKKLGTMKPEALKQGLIAMTVIITELTGMFWVMGTMQESAVKGGKGVKAVGTALVLMAVAMKIIASMKGDEFARAAAGIAGGLILMTGALYILSTKGKRLTAAGNAMEMMSVSLIALAVAMKVMATIGWEGLAVALVGMAAGLGAMIGAAVLVQKLKLDVTMLAIGTAMALMGVAAVGLGAGLLLTARALKILGKAGSTALKGLEILGKAVIVLVKGLLESILEFVIDSAPMIGEAAVALLAAAGEAILGAVTELVEPLIEAIVLLVDSLSKDNRIYEITAGLIDICVQFLLAALQGLAAAAPELVDAFFNLLSEIGIAIGDAFGKLDMKDILMGTAAIAILVASMKVLAMCKTSIKDALIVAGALLLISASFAGLFLLLGNVDGKNAIMQATAMSEIMLAFSAMTSILGNMSIKSALKAIADFEIFLGILTATLAVLGGLNQIEGFSDLIDSGGEILIKLGDILGSSVGAIVKGFTETVSEALPTLGANLEMFFESIATGLGYIGDIDSGVFESTKLLAEAMLLFTASELIDGISSFLGGKASLVDFAKKLVEFAPHIVEYTKALKDGDISLDDIEKSAAAGKILAEFAKAAPKEGGLWQQIAGSTDLESFGKQLEAFAPSLMAYAETTQGLTGAMVQGSVDAAGLIVDLVDKMPASGGWKQKILGEKDVSQFGKNLISLGGGLSTYVSMVGWIKEGAATAAGNALQILIDLANDLPESGGWKQTVLGDKDLSDFAGQLKTLGQGIIDYAKEIEGLDTGKVEASTAGVGMLIDLGAKFAESTTGIYDMGDFGGKMETLGSYYASFYSYINRTIPEKVSKAIEVMGELVDVAGSQNGERVEKFATALYNLSQVTLDTFIESFDGAGTDIKEVGSSAMNKLVNGVAETATSSFTLDLVKGAGASLAESLIEGLGSKDEDIDVATFGLVSAIKTDIEDEQTQMSTAAATLANKFLSGFSSGTVKINLAMACGELIGTMLDKLKGYNSDFWEAGNNCVLGFARGITDNTYKAKAAAAAMAYAAKKAAEKELDEHSPSKEFQQIGMYCVTGFVKGITDNTKYIKKAVKKSFGKQLLGIVNAEIDTFSKVFKKNGVKKVTKEVEKSIRDLGTRLYKQSDAYKETKKQLKEYNKQLEKLQKKQAKLKKQANTKENKKQLEQVEKDIKETKKNIKNLQKQAAKDAINVFKEYYKGIKNQAKEFIDMFSIEIDSQIDLLSASLDSQIDLLSASLDSQMDLFTKFEGGEKITTTRILKNMQSQVNGIAEWKKNLTELAKSGISEGLLQKLKDMGPSGANYVKTFLKMTSAQLKQANKLFQKEQAVAAKNMLNEMKQKVTDYKTWTSNLASLVEKGLNEGLINKLREMGPEGAEYVNAFLSMTTKQIKAANKQFKEEQAISAQNMLNDMTNKIADYRKWSKNLSKLVKKGLDEGIIRNLREMGPEGAEYVNAFLTMTADQIKQANDLFAQEQAIANQNYISATKQKVTDLKNWAVNMSALAAKGLDEGIIAKLIEMGPEGAEYVNAFMSMTAKEIGKINKNFRSASKVTKKVADEIVAAYAYAGTASAKGFADGITAGKAEAINAAIKLANEALKAAKKKLGIKSPSKEFGKIGEFAGEGFVNALTDYADRSYDAGVTLADSAEDGLNDAISKIVDIIHGDIDDQPTITPVLDLSNVRAGADELNSIFGGSNSIYANGTINSALHTQADISGVDSNGEIAGNGNIVYNFNQYNSSPKALNRLDIYRQTRNQFAMLKGVSNA